MSNKPTGGPAFPSKGSERARRQAEAAGVEYNEPPGMDLVDYFAAKSLSALIICHTGQSLPNPKWAADRAYEYARAMLESRK